MILVIFTLQLRHNSLMEPKQLDDTKTQSIIGSSTISHGSNLMALYMTYPEWLAPGNWSVNTYWQISGNIQFIYGTVEEAKVIFEKVIGPALKAWYYDANNDRYYLTTAKDPSKKSTIIRYVIALVKNGSNIDPEELCHE